MLLASQAEIGEEERWREAEKKRREREREEENRWSEHELIYVSTARRSFK